MRFGGLMLPYLLLFVNRNSISYKIQEIKRVQDICRDIKKLDFAKKNITTAVRSLPFIASQWFTMVVSADEQLQVMASKRQYKEAAAQLEGLTKAEQDNILDVFKNHGPISTQLSVAAAMPQPPAPPLAITNPAALHPLV
ncbi:vacuolar protein sorting-associated protein 53 A [Eutrema salsugineum]|uniref:vacuolar protein sorting-associated protein 53 A n=1 Tax=Eutrema salsugineum TaxID=72664 RepID=UPI000CED33DB|nr:vacuolar protein sorting-associated protein 53 A [Eutrema salsugineum]XP_024006301.1 vacuolar protein sorting-associated protein 53 A [Eutrema salsugineum]